MDNILFLSVMSGAAWGGSEELWYQAALWTARNGHNVGVCCFDNENKTARMDELVAAGCKLYLLPAKKETKKKPLLGKIKLNKAVADVPFEKYDKVIVNQGGWNDVAHGPFKTLFNRLKSYVLVYHNYNVNEKFSKRKSSLLQQWAEKATQNLGATLKIFVVLEEVYGIHIPRQELLYNPLTIDTPGTTTPFLPSTNNKYLFSVLATLDVERKAQDILIIGLSGPEWKDRNWELHIYGEGKDKAFLQKMTSRLQLQDKVFIHGNAKNYKEAIRQSQLVLQITHIDAMPISVIEAMAMSRPLVVSRVGDMPLWIKEEQNGWIVDTVSGSTIHDTMEKAWQHRGEWERMGKESFAIFKEQFPADPIEYFLRQTGILL